MIKKISEVYEFRLANGVLAGTIEWDTTWSCYRFISKGCRLDLRYMKEVFRFMEKLK